MFLRSLYAGILTLLIASQSYLSAQPIVIVEQDDPIFDPYRFHHHHHDHTFVGPTLRGITASPVCCYGAYSFLFEIAPRNFRFDATFAYQVADNHYFKATVDLLSQKLRYRDIKDKHVWTHQESYGLAYAYDWNCGILSTLDADFYWTRAHNKNFSNLNDSFFFINPDFPAGATINRLYQRHISGARAYGFSFGFTLEPFQCTRLSLAANYDNIDYRTKYRSLPQKAGWGGSVELHHQLFEAVGIDFLGEWRRPYDNYQAAINWYFCGCCPCDRAAFGIFGGYTNGKYGVPNVGNAGLQFAYWFGGNNGSCGNYGTSCDPCDYDPCCEPCSCFDIVDWASRPAVFQPVVLTTHDTSIFFTLNAPELE